MRTVLASAAALVAGFVLSAVAQNAATQSSGSQQQASGSTQSSGCGKNAMPTNTSDGVRKGGFTDVTDVPKAFVVHAVDPDGNPVIMVVAPAQ